MAFTKMLRFTSEADDPVAPISDWLRRELQISEDRTRERRVEAVGVALDRVASAGEGEEGRQRSVGRVVALLDRRVEGVHVDVQDDALPVGVHRGSVAPSWPSLILTALRRPAVEPGAALRYTTFPTTSPFDETP